MTYRLICLALLALALAAVPAAWAQAPPAANAPLPGSDFLHSNDEPEPDTTAPWRYFPLEVGNVWEYAVLDLSGNDTGRTLRRHISGDTLAPNGHRYAVLVTQNFYAAGTPTSSSTRYLRYDTLSARVLKLYAGGIEDGTFDVPCPLNADFETIASCYTGEEYSVTGDYDGVLDFEPDTTVTGVPYKTYENSFEAIRYAAGFGEVLYVELKGTDQYVLEACRVDGVEYGTPQFPVGSEGAPVEATPLRMEAYPNPFRETLTVAFEIERPEAWSLTVFDAQGRRVLLRDPDVLPPGRHEVKLGGSALAPGLFFVRLSGVHSGAYTRPVVRLR